MSFAIPFLTAVAPVLSSVSTIVGLFKKPPKAERATVAPAAPAAATKRDTSVAKRQAERRQKAKAAPKTILTSPGGLTDTVASTTKTILGG